MDTELSIIPQRTKVLYGTYAEIAALSVTLKAGELAFATDRVILYRWSGAALVAITISSRHGNIANIGNAADYPESSLYQADDESKLYMIISGAWVYISQIPFAYTYSTSESLVHSNDTERGTNSVSFVKLKESKLQDNFNVLRIKFTLRNSAGTTVVHGQIYKNGVAIGTNQTNNSPVGVEFSQDFSNLSKNDLIQVYAYTTNAAYAASVSNLRFCYSLGLVNITDTAGY